MSRILVIAEKPSVARDYARVLHCTQKGEGCLFNDQYVVTWAIGHLIELCEPEAYDEKYKRWNRSDLPIIPEQMKLRVIRGSGKQFKIVKQWMKDKDIDRIICGTDSGREGELIFRYIYMMAGCNKPFDRLWVSSMTNEAIQEGFENLKNGHEYDDLYESARCRSEADWLVGMNGSRAFTIHYNALLSIGRVQTPTLAIIARRDEEIKAFVPKDFWEVEIGLEQEKVPFKAKWFTWETTEEDGKQTKHRNTQIEDKDLALKIQERNSAGTIVTVTQVERQTKKQLPPLLYDLTELQRDGNRKYGYSAAKVLSIAQNLYEKHKLITYPRTDSRYLSHDMKETVRKTLHAMDTPEFHPWLMKIPGLNFNGRIIDDSKITDHHAIIPTPRKPDLSALSEEEARIYRLVAYRLISVFYPAYEYETTTVTFSAGEDLFLARGRHVLVQGYTEIPANGSSSSKKKAPEDAELPALEEGMELPIKNTKIIESKTKPPTPFTEATLLSAMEYAGKYIEDEALQELMKKTSLGTPATRAATIERLIKVGYVKRAGKTLRATDKGLALIHILPKELTSPEMTAKWERALDKIYQGNMDPEAFMNSIKRYVRFIVGAADAAPPSEDAFIKAEAARKTKRKNGAPANGLGTCPLCKKGTVLRNSKAYYCTEWKQGCKWNVWLDSLSRYGEILDDDLIREILSEGSAVRPVTMPQTFEKGTARFFFNEKGALEMKEFKREEGPV